MVAGAYIASYTGLKDELQEGELAKTGSMKIHKAVASVEPGNKAMVQ